MNEKVKIAIAIIKDYIINKELFCTEKEQILEALLNDNRVLAYINDHLIKRVVYRGIIESDNFTKTLEVIDETVKYGTLARSE